MMKTFEEYLCEAQKTPTDILDVCYDGYNGIGKDNDIMVTSKIDYKGKPYRVSIYMGYGVEAEVGSVCCRNSQEARDRECGCDGGREVDFEITFDDEPNGDVEIFDYNEAEIQSDHWNWENSPVLSDEEKKDIKNLAVEIFKNNKDDIESGIVDWLCNRGEADEAVRMEEESRY